MATIKYVTTPDGVTHNIGGGGTVVTYSISLGAVSSNTVPIILTGSNGTTDTVYVKGGGDATMSVSGDTMTITATSGQTITYTLSGSGTTTTYTITNTPSSGTASSVTIPAATTSAAGLMTSSDKSKLDGIASGAEVNVQSDWSQTDSTADDYIKNKPTIPTVNNGKLTIQKNGTTVSTFTANQSGNATANITVPTATSDLTNDSDFVSDASYVHTDNNFTNAYVTKLNGIESGAEVNVQADWNEADSSSDAYIKNKPTIPSVGDGTLTIQKNGSTIDTFTANQSSNTTVNVTVPTATSDLTNDSDFVSDASYVHTDNNFTTTLKNKLNGIQAGAEVNVQSDWNQADSTADDYIKNKPTLATVATSGDYDDLTNKPTIPSVSVTQKTTTGTNIADITINGTTTELYAPSGGGGNVQADWAETNPSADSYIQNKPTTVSITPVTKKTVVTGGTTTSITPVTKKTVVTGVTPATVVTGGTTTSITPVLSKTVVTSASGATATVATGVLTLTNGSFGTGESVTTGTAINAYTTLNTGDSVTVTTGDSVTTGTAIDAYTSLTTGDSVTEGTAVNVYKS